MYVLTDLLTDLLGRLQAEQLARQAETDLRIRTYFTYLLTYLAGCRLEPYLLTYLPPSPTHLPTPKPYSPTYPHTYMYSGRREAAGRGAPACVRAQS